MKMHQVKYQKQDKTRMTQRGSLIKTEGLSGNPNPDMQKENNHREGFKEGDLMVSIYCYVSNRHRWTETIVNRRTEGRRAEA